MPALKACFEAERLQDVATYIQSGNVLFTADRSSQQALTARIEKALSRTFAYEARVVVRSFEQMRTVVHASAERIRHTARRSSVRCHLPEAPADSGRGAAKRDRQTRGRSCLRWRRRAVLLAPHCQSNAKPAQSRRRQARVSEHDHPQLEHDPQAVAVDGGHASRYCARPCSDTASPQRGPCAAPPRCGADRIQAYPAGCATPPSTGPHPRRRSRTDRSGW